MIITFKKYSNLRETSNCGLNNNFQVEKLHVDGEAIKYKDIFENSNNFSEEEFKGILNNEIGHIQFCSTDREFIQEVYEKGEIHIQNIKSFDRIEYICFVIER